MSEPAWGRIGAAGQTQTKSFSSAIAAQREADKMIGEKTRKGYGAVAIPSKAAAKPARPVAPRTPPKPHSDLAALRGFLASLDGPTLVALPPSSSRFTQSDGHTDPAERILRAKMPKETPYVFWHTQSADRAFDREGELVSTLVLHWGGEHETVRDALGTLTAPYGLVDGGPDGAFEIRKPTTSEPTDEAGMLRRIDAEWSSETPDLGWVRRMLETAPPRAFLWGANLLILRNHDDAALPGIAALVAQGLEAAAAVATDRDSRPIEDSLDLLRRTKHPVYRRLRDAFRTSRKPVLRWSACFKLRVYADGTPETRRRALTLHEAGLALAADELAFLKIGPNG